MKYILRLTRFVVSLIVSLHVAALRIQARLVEREEAKQAAAVDKARTSLERAQAAATFARVNIREQGAKLQQTKKNCANIKLAADAECRFYGRELVK